MLQVIPLAAFNDNYIWLLKNSDPANTKCWVVDPGEADPVIAYLEQEQLDLQGILLTHHHKDHIGGVEDLRQPGVEIVGCAADAARLPTLTQAVTAGDKLQILGQPVDILAVPGHTLGHLVYYFPATNQPLLFSGDTLFAAGCGRRFEGSAAQMQASLHKLAQLPANTQIFAAHEYTLSNLNFALLVEPDNQDLQARLQQCQELRNNNQPTLPSNLALELASNPFLRLNQPQVIASLHKRHPEADLSDPVIAFDLLRQWKDVA